MATSKLIFNIFIIFIILIALFLILPVLPIPGNYKILMVQSGSMQPAVKLGSLVIVKPAKNYKIGEIITFRDKINHISITHRIYDMRLQAGTPIYITKGDANDIVDKREIFPNEIIGKVWFSLPYLGYLMNFAKKPFAFVSITFILAIMIIWTEVGKIIKMRKH